MVIAFSAQAVIAGAQQREGIAWSSAVQIGAPVRVVDRAGQLTEGRVAGNSDSVLWLQSRTPAGQRILVSDIQSIEARVAPESRNRTILISAGLGTILGALAGAASHDDSGGSPGLGAKPGRFENVSVGALFGAAAGWGLAHFVFARARWRHVRLPGSG
jgi:hypothetical protein